MNVHSFFMGVNMALEKPELIMAHAEQLFISHGFHGTSMQMIAKAAGIAAGTVYLHFASKEGLIYPHHLPPGCHRYAELSAERL